MCHHLNMPLQESDFFFQRVAPLSKKTKTVWLAVMQQVREFESRLEDHIQNLSERGGAPRRFQEKADAVKK